MLHKMKLKESPLIKKNTNSMYEYYSREKEKQYSVLGIKISLN